ncbi:MAG: bacterial Ig-like domain-containing protein [Oscillospiraceae bacterium]|nr:bacterial Ig-like domain-containing protein [Oscillospiraceae bacterium]
MSIWIKAISTIKRIILRFCTRILTVTDTALMNFSGFDSKKTGEQTVTVEYGGLSAGFTVNVKYAWWQRIIKILLLGFLWY